VTGTVKLKGQPLKEGFISFSPLENQNTQAQVLIASGSYRMEQKHGLRPGKYLIRVSAGDGKTPVLDRWTTWSWWYQYYLERNRASGLEHQF
jgi:hypothetical protein